MATILFARRLWSLDLLCIFIISLTQKIAFASLYPTKPISTTVFSAGRPAQLEWVEDGHPPLLSDLGHMKIHLLAGNCTYISTIAKDVNPLSSSITVYIPQIIPANYHTYTLRFVPSRFPLRPIFTVPFTILPNPFSYLLVSSTSHPPNSVTTSVYTPASSEIVPNPDVTPVSRITGTQAAMPNASGKYVPTQQDSGSSSCIFEFGVGWRLGKNFMHATVGRRPSVSNVDMKKMKFRLRFFVWPALIGFSLAM